MISQWHAKLPVHKRTNKEQLFSLLLSLAYLEQQSQDHFVLGACGS